MKNITLSAEESLIRNAREKARQEKTSLNKRFREWLKSYVGQSKSEEDYDALMEQLKYARPGRHFTREELNER